MATPRLFRSTRWMTEALRPRIALVGVLVLIGSLAGTSTSAAGAGQEPGRPAAPGARHRVTLVTGDAVEFTELDGGRSTFTVEPARRPGRGAVTFHGSASTRPDGQATLHVVPSDVERHVRSGVLDKGLFDVRELTREGLADNENTATPMIITYRAPVALAALPAAADRRIALPSVNGVAVTVTPAAAADFWTALDRRALLGQDIAKVWLDRKVTPALERSAAQIGAPAAWQAGLDGRGVKVAVLDSGLDATHPDLAGRVTGSANFTTEPSTVDGNGHGTHVASILGGSGAASGGRYRGIAPGAQLMVGKVVGAKGTGQWSWVMAGMEWAVSQGARVVSLSLGGGATDGTDPVSQTVDRLTERTGALFVVAAGNNGGPNTVNTPGSASSALTVGAVDPADRLAGFSSRGPRLRDAAPKPELTAPGVGIIAARAAGTGIGQPVDAHYTAVSGTSMATPEVAGAAAILAQAHPDWTAPRIKQQLVSTAKDGGYQWHEQGAGRVDLTAALRQTLSRTPPDQIGRLQANGSATTRKLAYANSESSPVSIDLAVTARGWTGAMAPTGAVRLSSTTMTVPAAGSSTVDLTVAPAGLAAGIYGGIVTATRRDGSALRTPFGFYVEPALRTVRLLVTNVDGTPTEAADGTLVSDTWAPGGNDPYAPAILDFSAENGSATVSVPDGTYTAHTAVYTQEAEIQRITYLVAAEVPVSGDTDITLDGRKAVRSSSRTAEPVDQVFTASAVERITAARLGSTHLAGGEGNWETFVTPAPAPRTGKLTFSHDQALSQRLVSMAVRHSGATRELSPGYDPLTAPGRLSASRTVPTVFAGAGTPAELGAAGVSGKLALVRLPVPEDQDDPVGWLRDSGTEAVSAAAAAGAVGAVVYADRSGALPIPGLPSVDTLALSLGNADGEWLRAALDGAATVTVVGRSQPDYSYNLHHAADNGIAANLEHRIDHGSLTAVPTRYHATAPGVVLERKWTAVPLAPNSWGSRLESLSRGPGPLALTELYGPSSDQVAWLRSASYRLGQGHPAGRYPVFQWADTVFRAGERTRGAERWFSGPLRVGTVDGDPAGRRTLLCTFCRTDQDVFVPGLQLTDSTPGHFVDLAYYSYPGTVRLYDGSREIAPLPASVTQPFPRFPLPAGAGVYRLEADTELSRLFHPVPTRTRSVWTFRSAPATTAPPAGTSCYPTDQSRACAFQPILQVRPRIDLDLADRAPAGRQFGFDLGVGPHPGTQSPATVNQPAVAYSTDSGRSWQPATVGRAGNNQYRVTVSHPALRDTTGAVWLRVRAEDTAGNSVDQTVEHAYGLTEGAS